MVAAYMRISLARASGALFQLGIQMKYQTIVTAVAEGVATLTLNRPEKRNAMSPRMHEEVTDALDDLRYNDEAAVVVITGAGNSFCAGMDLEEFFHDLKVEKPREFDRIFRLATEWRGRTLRQYPKATIAMVNGYCFGGAFSIVEGCDLAVPPTKPRSASERSISAPSPAAPSPSRSRTSCIRGTRCTTR